MRSRRVGPFAAMGFVLFAAVSVTPVGLRAVPQGQQKVALVTVVADASGRVNTLTAKDFVITEDNAPREVVDAQLADDPLSVALLIDTTQPPMGTNPPTQDLRTAVTTFVRLVQASSPQAKISLTEMGGAAVTPVNFTTNFAELEKAINKLVPNQPRYAVLLEALEDASKRLGEQPPPRRAIVSIDFNSQEGSADKALKPAIEGVHKAGATLWAISVRGTASTNPIREDALNKMTQANGGMRLQPVDPSGLDSNMRIVANSLTSQYTVTFKRPDGAKPKTTTIATTKGGKVLLSPWMR